MTDAQTITDGLAQTQNAALLVLDIAIAVACGVYVALAVYSRVAPTGSYRAPTSPTRAVVAGQPVAADGCYEDTD